MSSSAEKLEFRRNKVSVASTASQRAAVQLELDVVPAVDSTRKVISLIKSSLSMEPS